MDLRQVVRYAGETQDTAIARMRADLAPAAAAGFRPVASERWDARRPRPTLVVEYRFEPPATLERRVVTLQHLVADRVALDAGELALAGYVLDEQRVLRNIRSGLPALSTVELSYRYDPDLVGEPVAPIPPLSEEPAEPWLPVRHLLQAVRLPPGPTATDVAYAARRTLLRALGAPRAAIRQGDR